MSALNSSLCRSHKADAPLASPRRDLTHEHTEEPPHPLQGRHRRHTGPQGSQSPDRRRSGRRRPHRRGRREPPGGRRPGDRRRRQHRNAGPDRRAPSYVARRDAPHDAGRRRSLRLYRCRRRDAGRALPPARHVHQHEADSDRLARRRHHHHHRRLPLVAQSRAHRRGARCSRRRGHSRAAHGRRSDGQEGLGRAPTGGPRAPRRQLEQCRRSGPGGPVRAAQSGLVEGRAPSRHAHPD